MADEYGVVALASNLVSIPSVNGNEGELVAFLARYLEEAGLEVSLSEAAPGRPNLFATWRKRVHAQTELGLLFHAHTDTVPAYGMADPFSAKVQDGHIWGRGSVDQKGGLAAAAAALATVARGGERPGVPIGLAAVVDEESEHRGSMALVRSKVRAKRAVVTEPSGLRVVVGCKGTVPLRVRVRGQAAHGCRPWLGVNAVVKAMDVADYLLGMELPKVDLPGLSSVQGTVNLGVFQGGVAYNIVPDFCELWFDRRTVPGETQSEVLGQVQDMLRRLGAADRGLDAVVDVARPDWGWEPIAQRGLNPTITPLDSGLKEWVSDHHACVTGSPPEYCFTDGYNEMDFLINDMAIPAVQYGPGASGLCHTDEERLDVQELIACTRVYEAMIRDTAFHRG